MPKLALLYSGLHVFSTQAAIMLSFGRSMREFDTPHADPAPDLLGAVAEVLVQPGHAVWSQLRAPGVQWLEWPMFAANSLLWGTGLAVATRFLLSSCRTKNEPA